MVYRVGLAVLAATALLTMPGWAQELVVPGASFEDGDEQAIAHWALENGAGRPTTDNPGDGARSALLEGNPEATSYWRSEPLPFAPRTVYALHYLVKQEGEGGGPPIAGPVFANDVLYNLEEGRWLQKNYVFQTPDAIGPERAWLRLGQARMAEGATVAYDAVRVVPVQPVNRWADDIELGFGERIEGNRFYSAPMWDNTFRNQHRSLYSYNNTVYNLNAFLMGDGSEVVMRHEVGNRNHLSAEITVRPLYYFGGTLVVEASANGEEWVEIHRFTEREGLKLSLPESLFPAHAIWVRLRCEADEPVGIDLDLGALGVSVYEFYSDIDGPPVELTGATDYVEVLKREPEVPVTVIETGDLVPYGDNVYVISIENPATEPMPVTARVVVEQEGRVVYDRRFQSSVAGASSGRLNLPYEMYDYGDHTVTVSFDEGPQYAARSVKYVSPLFATGYGERLPGSTDDTALWWASSGWRVARRIPVPEAQGEAIRMALARNETEAAQLVVRPENGLTGFIAKASDLEGPDGGVIPADRVEVLRVRYVPVEVASDRFGAVAPWPEALPPFRGPIDLQPGENQPVWVRVHADAGLPAGIYHGEITLTADGYEAAVPLDVEVYDFDLPHASTIETAFGGWRADIGTYHRAKTEDEQRQVWEMYLQAMSDYRLSPYRPAQFDRIEVEWPEPGEPLEAKLDWTAFEREMERIFEQYRFNTVRVPIEGLFGAKYPDHRREIAGYPADTPEFEALFNSYASQVEAFLREKGWLDKAYVYWMDEPRDADIPFTQSGFALLKNAAPGLRRMIAINKDHQLPKLVSYVNLWCPQIDKTSREFIQERRDAGERAWWYVCTIPKGPNPGLFIDHPAVNMRVWSWMAWDYDVEGLLIWATTRWHSQAAYHYSDELQNMYEDPMTWAGNAGPGVRFPFGNGDGFFFFPPESVFEDDGEGVVLEPPVGSVRGDMLRDGVEDYEYFVILRDLLEEKGGRLSRRQRAAYQALLASPQDVYTSRTAYSFDPAPMERHRARLARAIMELQARVR